MSQLILHIPHSSISIPLKDGYVVNDDVLNLELLKLTDWHTEDLFCSETDIMIIANFSRIFCDPERFADDSKEIMSQFGMGVLYERTDGGELMRTISSQLRERILSEYYWRHHNNLTQAVEDQLEKFSKAIIIDCHSFPDQPFISSVNKRTDRPDFNIGTDSFHTPLKFVDASVDFFRSRGYSLGIDWPYNGSIVPTKYYQQEDNVQSIMLEINRKLYLVEKSNRKLPGYHDIRKITHDYIEIIRQCS